MEPLHRSHAHSSNPVVPPSDSAFFDRVLDRIDPHREPWDVGLWYVQLICGRWLALRRIQQHLSLATLADQIRVDSQTLRCLEEGAGLVAPQGVPERGWTRLAARLSFEGAETAWIERIITHALGQIQSPDHTLIDQVLTQLESLQETPVEQVSAPVVLAPNQQPEAVRLDHDIFALLDLIVSMPRHSIDLADRVGKDSPTVNGLLIRMQSENLITKDGQRIDPELDPDIPLTYYRVTASGQQAHATERRIRDLEQAARPGLPSTNLIPGT